MLSGLLLALEVILSDCRAQFGNLFFLKPLFLDSTAEENDPIN